MNFDFSFATFHWAFLLIFQVFQVFTTYVELLKILGVKNTLVFFLFWFDIFLEED